MSEPIDCDSVNANWDENQGLYDTGTGNVQLGDDDAASKVSDFFDVVVSRIRCLEQNDVATLLGGAWLASFRKNYMERLLDEWGVTNSQVRDILAAGSTYIEFHQWPIIASNWKTPHESLNGHTGCKTMSMALIRGAVYEVGVMTPARINQARMLATSKVGRVVLGIFGSDRAIETVRLAGVEAVFDDEGELGQRARSAEVELTDYLCGLEGIEDVLNTTADELLGIITLPSEEESTSTDGDREPGEGIDDSHFDELDLELEIPEIEECNDGFEMQDGECKRITYTDDWTLDIEESIIRKNLHESLSENKKNLAIEMLKIAKKSGIV